ncbi:MAG: MATE family efflux transporter, partial [Candidatus Cloacimonadota bacterium]
RFSCSPDIFGGRIWKVLINLSLPIILAHLFHTLYSITDAFWLGKIGKTALAAPTITFNVLFVIIAIAGGLSIGGTTLLAQYKGAGNEKKVNDTAANTLVLIGIISIFLAAVGYMLSPHLLRLLQTPMDAFPETLTYMRIMFFGVPFIFGFFIYRGLMQGYGDTISPLKVIAFTVTLNVMLDPFLIFGWGPFPRMGVAGAAIATVFSHGIASVIGIVFLISGKYGLKLSFRGFRFNRSIIKSIFRIGFPMAISQTGTSLGFTILMGIVNTFGTSVIGAFGIGNRIILLMVMPAMGLAQGSSTIVAQNIGADQVERAERSVWTAVSINSIAIFLFATLLFFFGGYVVKFFINDPEVIEIGHRMFKIISYSVLFFSIMIVFTGAFQGSGHTMPVFIMQMIRLWGLRIPCVLFLSKYLHYGDNGIFWGMTISNLIIAIIAFFWFKSGAWKQKVIKTLRI